MCFCRGGGSLTVKHAELSLVQVAGTAGKIWRGESSLASLSNDNSDACELRNLEAVDCDCLDGSWVSVCHIVYG